MPNDPTVPADGSPETPASPAPDTVTSPSQDQSGGTATASADAGTVPSGDGTDHGSSQNGHGDGDTPMVEPPALSLKDQRAYATYSTCKQMKKPLPPGFTPSKAVLAYWKWKSQAAGDGVPRKENGSGDGAKADGEASPAPAAESKDPIVRLRAQYATLDKDKVEEVMAADWYLEHLPDGAAISREDLVDMKPDARVKLAVSLKKRDGNMARMAGQASPRQTPPKRPADGSPSATLPANKPAPQAQPKIDVLSDAPQEVRDALGMLDEPEAKALTDFIAGKIQPPKTEPEEETEAEEAPQFSPQEERLVRGNVKLLETEAAKEFPWLTQKGAKEMVAERVKALAERLNLWPAVLTDFDQLRSMYFDAATVVFSREIKGSKTATAQAAAVTAPAVRAPQARAARGARELSQSELRSIASRAAREANGNPEENKRLFAKYREEARGS